MNILDETELTFRRRDVDAARRIEPMVQVISDLVTHLKQNHLKRMSRGECDIIADSIFGDMMVEFRRIADACSNVGVATVVRVTPALADHEHIYYESLHDGTNEEYNTAYRRAYDRYFSLLRRDDRPAEKYSYAADAQPLPVLSDEPEAE